MHRIDNATAAAVLPTPAAPGTPGFFTNGNPLSGTEATIVDEDWGNAVQEELSGPVEASGLALDKTDRGQLLKALRRLFQNRAYAAYATNASLTAVIPIDDTKPQVSEGTEILSVTITPRSSTSRMRVRFQGAGAVDSVAVLGWSAAVFLNGATDALCAGTVTCGANLSHVAPVAIEFEHVPGSTAAQTYTVRVGPQNGTLRLNGVVGGRYLGGALAATLIVEEIMA